MTPLHQIVLRSPREGCGQTATAGIRLRVALPVDQPLHHSRLLEQMIDPKSAREQLRRAVRAVDRHGLCVGHGVAEEQAAWSVVGLAPAEGN